VPCPLVAAAIAAGGVAWLVALRLTNHVLLGEINRLVAKGRRLISPTPAASLP